MPYPAFQLCSHYRYFWRRDERRIHDPVDGVCNHFLLCMRRTNVPSPHTVVGASLYGCQPRMIYAARVSVHSTRVPDNIDN